MTWWGPVNVSEAFERYQKAVNADAQAVKEARRLRDLFREALRACDDVLLFRPSGSVARGTQKHPIHDVDVIVVFDSGEHPAWGQSGDSASEALERTGTLVNETLGARNGTYAQASGEPAKDPDSPGNRVSLFGAISNGTREAHARATAARVALAPGTQG